MEQCHHYSSTTGQRCANKAKLRIREQLSSDSAAPKWWVCYTCDAHAQQYVVQERYEVLPL